MAVKNGVDSSSVEGATTLPYAIPDLSVELCTTPAGVPVLWWRSVGSTHAAYSTETFLDELASAAGRDPVELRRALLAKRPRHLAALELAAGKAGWGTALPAGRARGRRGPRVVQQRRRHLPHPLKFQRRRRPRSARTPSQSREPPPTTGPVPPRA